MRDGEKRIRCVIGSIWAIGFALLVVDSVLVAVTDRTAAGPLCVWGLASIAVAAVWTVNRRTEAKTQMVLAQIKRSASLQVVGEDGRRRLRALR